MNEPPIASPFGDAAGATASPHAAPWILKILVGIHLTRAVSSVCVLAVHPRSSIVTPGEIAFNVVLFALYLGLLRGLKISWWLVEAWMAYAVIYPLCASFLSGRQIPSISRIYPPLVDQLLSALAVALFVYLLTPQARRFFFVPRTTSRL